MYSDGPALPRGKTVPGSDPSKGTDAAAGRQHPNTAIAPTDPPSRASCHLRPFLKGLGSAAYPVRCKELLTRARLGSATTRRAQRRGRYGVGLNRSQEDAIAVAVVMDFNEATLEQYDRVIDKMHLTAGGPGPSGAMFHWCAATDSVIRLTDVWQSREQFDAFANDQIGPFSAVARDSRATPGHVLRRPQLLHRWRILTDLLEQIAHDSRSRLPAEGKGVEIGALTRTVRVQLRSPARRTRAASSRNRLSEGPLRTNGFSL
jgi:hypothetical protein